MKTIALSQVSGVRSDLSSGGLMHKVIAIRHGVSRPFVRKVARLMGIPKRTPGPVNERHADVKRGLMAGKPGYLIAAEFKVRPGFVSYVRKKSGMPPAKRGPK